MVAQLTCFRPRKHGILEKAVFLDQGLQLKTENASTVDLLSLYMMGRNSLTPEEETVQKASQCATITENGIVEADESAPVDIKDSDIFWLRRVSRRLTIGTVIGHVMWKDGPHQLVVSRRATIVDPQLES